MPRAPAALPTRPAPPSQSGLTAALLATLIIGSLYFGREIFVPIALAVLLSFALAPLVRILQKIYVPRAAAVAVVVLLAFSAIFSVGTVIVSQVAQLAADLPKYQMTIREKIQSIKAATPKGGALERAATILQDLSKELDRPNSSNAPAAIPPEEPAAEQKPVPVEVRTPPPTALESLAALLAPLIYPLATTGIILIFVVFILLQREELRNRIIRLAGTRDLQRTTGALDDAAKRLSKLFLAQLIVNTSFGLAIGIGLWLIGVPSPALWGIFAAILRFVPYIGAIIGAIFPLALSAAVDPGWSMLLWTAALFVVVEPIVGHVIEPIFYGHTTGLSSFAVVAAATFWTALWGPIGLVLATPLTICLVVLGRHFESLKFLDVMLGDRPALSPSEIFYQRVLAGDPIEAIDKADRYLKRRSLCTYYDAVVRPGLLLAQTDLTRETLEPRHVETIRETSFELIEQLEDYELETPRSGESSDAEVQAAVEQELELCADLPKLDSRALPLLWRENGVLCVAGRTPIDEIGAAIMAQILSKHGIPAHSESASALSYSNVVNIEKASPPLVILSYFDGYNDAFLPHLVRRLRRRLPNAKIVLGCWFLSAEAVAPKDKFGADFIAGSFHEATKIALQQAQIVDSDQPQKASRSASA